MVETVTVASERDQSKALKDLEYRTLDRIRHWLDGQGEAVRPSDRAAIPADLADLYAGATRYQRMIDRLLELPPDARAETSAALAELSVELWHLAWHIRSVKPKLERLAGAIEPDADVKDGET